MPSRLISLGIVVFWLATSAWLFQRELWPRLKPNEPPPYTIDLVDEARDHAAPIRWTVYRDGQKIGKASTSVSYNEQDDTFNLHNTMEHMELYRSRLMRTSIVLTKAHSVYRVTRQGELRGIEVDLAGGVLLPALEPFNFKAHVEGQVAGGRLTPTGYVEWLKERKDIQAEPVAVSAYGSVLNPLHPVNRIRGLRPGQTWRMPLVDPLGDVMAATAAEALAMKLPGLAGGPRYLTAVVSEPQSFTWGNVVVSCLIIEYQGDGDVTARTWVRESDGLVLRQEARQGELLVLQRDF